MRDSIPLTGRLKTFLYRALPQIETLILLRR
jgi:hypothetical protein